MTYNRAEALRTTLKGLFEHCKDYPIAVFEDAGVKDHTASFLTGSRMPEEEDYELEAIRWTAYNEPCEVYMGTRNLGVAGNTNRALAWFWRTGYDHLILCNDDILVEGDFAALYAEAHQTLDIGLFCFCDFDSETHRWVSTSYRGRGIKLLPRMTGIMMSITRQLVETIGFFDTSFPKAGNEHCDYTHRARLAGFMDVDDIPQNCLDIEQNVLKHQEVESSLDPILKPQWDAEAEQAMQIAASKYKTDGLFRPFQTYHIKNAGGMQGVGLEMSHLLGYTVVNSRTIVD